MPSVQGEKQTGQKYRKSMVITIPKTGTNLLKKCLMLMNLDNIPPAWSYKKAPKTLVDLNNPIRPGVVRDFGKEEDTVIARHLPYAPSAAEFLENNTNANLFIIRDPRSQLVSAAHALQKHRINGKKRSIQDLLLDFINARKENFLPSSAHYKVKDIPENNVLLKLDLLWHLGAYEFYQLFVPWMKEKNFYTARFENLVGKNGGGSDEAQLQEVKNIAQHLGVKFSDQELVNIAQNLFGGTSTFREGQSDSWRKHFTPEVTAAFKAHAGLMQLLIDLGYEKDTNW